MQNNLSYNKQQLKERPPIRQIAERFLNEGLRARLESFLRYIEENKMPFTLARCNTYESKFKSKSVFRVEIALGQACVPNTYAVKVFTADDKNLSGNQPELVQEKLNAYLGDLGEEMAEYYVRHQSRCRGCGKCRPGISLDILGETYSGLCACDMYVMRVTNPDEADYEMVKRFIAARKRHILESSSAK
jgi:hypothetical protein